MRSRVIPGSLVTIDRRVPVKRLKSVDLPTFGRPTMTSDGSLWAMDASRAENAQNRGGNAIFHCIGRGVDSRQSKVEGRKTRFARQAWSLTLPGLGGETVFLLARLLE